MTEGLVTRIGKWMDRKWEAAATCRELDAQEKRCADRHIGIIGTVNEVNQGMKAMGQGFEAISTKLNALPSSSVIDVLAKDVADLKTRLEKIELYSGMTRKVDPTKPPVAKSAFTM